MTPQDHSDTTLLVWADWLEENEQERRAHELREEIANPPIMKWNYEYRRFTVGGQVGNYACGVGGAGSNGIFVGGIDVGGGFVGSEVGIGVVTDSLVGGGLRGGSIGG